MRIVIAGGTGLIGNLLARHYHERGEEVIVLSRTESLTPWRTVTWDGRTQGAWSGVLEGAEVVINLAGRSVNCRYTGNNQREILRSRVESVRAIGEAVAKAKHPPAVWLQASTATIYAHRYDAANDEWNGILGGAEPGAPTRWRISTDVARAWEQAMDEFALPKTRTVKLRMGIVMIPGPGSAFRILQRLAQLGLGGRAGDGRQYVSWIHPDDLVRAIDFLLEHRGIAGAVNVTAPAPLPNSAFMRAIRQACGARFGIAAPVWLLEIAAFIRRTETELLLKSRRVVPDRLMRAGFTFLHPHWPEAVRDLCTPKGGEW